jgi:hypothetical protein
MVDYFALGLTHVLMALACWRLTLGGELDRDPVSDAGSGEDETRA